MAENTIWPFKEVTYDNAGAGPFQSKQALKLLQIHQTTASLRKGKHLYLKSLKKIQPFIGSLR